MQKQEPQRVQSVGRALDILSAVAQQAGLSTVASVADKTGLPSPTVYRLLSTLASRGYVIRLSHGHYTIGGAFFAISQAAAESIGVAVQGLVTELSGKLQESVSVAMLESGKALYIAHQMSSQSMMRAFNMVGNKVCLYATGVGKVLMANMPDDKLSELLQTEKLVRFTDKTLITEKALRKDLEKIRKLGYSIDDEEQEIGVRCTAMPIPGQPQMAVSVSGPPSRMTDKYIINIIHPQLAATAQAIGNLLHSE